MLCAQDTPPTIAHVWQSWQSTTTTEEQNQTPPRFSHHCSLHTTALGTLQTPSPPLPTSFSYHEWSPLDYNWPERVDARDCVLSILNLFQWGKNIGIWSECFIAGLQTDVPRDYLETVCSLPLRSARPDVLKQIGDFDTLPGKQWKDFPSFYFLWVFPQKTMNIIKWPCNNAIRNIALFQAVLIKFQTKCVFQTSVCPDAD